MIMPTLSYRRRVICAVSAGLILAPLFACSKETLLEVEDPDLIDPSAVQSAEGALGLRTGALGRFKTITGGGESTWLFGGLLADEWSTSSTFIQNDETDQRRIQLNNSSITGMFRSLARVRTATNQAIAALREFAPDSTSSIAEMYFARGFAEMQLAQDFCNGIPLTEVLPDTTIYGVPLPVSGVFDRAIASFDSALALTALDTAARPVLGETAADTLIRRAARVGKARALLGLARYVDANAALRGAGSDTIPTLFSYAHTFVATSGTNTIWGQGLSARRYTVGDSLEGNSRNLLVRNVIPFFSAKDTRLPVIYTVAVNSKDTTKRDTTKSQDGLTFSRTTTLYGRLTSLDVVNGIDARLVEAEAALRATDPVKMLVILNALRALRPTVGAVTPAAGSLPPLVDPVTPVARVNLLFREKAFWTFSRGQRLGDLRRLIRDYGRTPETTFPEGPHYRGGTYGPDVNLPVPEDERNNPNFTGCLNRDA
jgi:hypothetical protein